MTAAELKTTRRRLGLSRKALAQSLIELSNGLRQVSWRTVEGWEQAHPRTPIPRWLPGAMEKLISLLT
jgi:DNA-binding transcriptional regulator YiaG